MQKALLFTLTITIMKTVSVIMKHIFMKYKQSQTFCVLQYFHKPYSAIRNCLNNLYGKYGVLNYLHKCKKNQKTFIDY